MHRPQITPNRVLAALTLTLLACAAWAAEAN